MKTYRELLIEANSDFVQNASNLSGLIHSFSKVLTNLRELNRNVNEDLVTKLWVSKIVSLSHFDDNEFYFSKANDLIEMGIN